MDIDYSYLIGNLPLKLVNVGTLSSPILSSIFGENGISYMAYNTYVSLAMLDVPSYYEIFQKKEQKWFEEQTDEFISTQSLYRLITEDETARNAYVDAFNFFFKDEVIFDDQNKAFALFDGTVNSDGYKIVTGLIFEEIFEEILSAIAILNGSKRDEETEQPKYKNKIAQKFYAKILKGRLKKRKTEKTNNKDFELPNIISAVVATHNSLNYTNIYDLTITQLYDIFRRMRQNSLYSMSAMTVSVWGDKSNQFKVDGWFENINSKQ